MSHRGIFNKTHLLSLITLAMSLANVHSPAQGVMLPVLDRQGGWNCNVSHHTLLRDFEQRVKKSDLHTRSNRGASVQPV